MKASPILYLALISLFMTAQAHQCAQAGSMLYEEKFEEAGIPLDELNWMIEAGPDESRWEIKDGRLVATCYFKPYKGGRIVREIPFTDRGELTFKVKFPVAAGYNHFSLQVGLGNLVTSFKYYNQNLWQRNFENQWKTVAGRIPRGEWVTFKIRFDNDLQVVEYYAGDMENPAHIDTHITIGPAQGRDFFSLMIGNYGLATGDSGMLVHEIDDIAYSSTSDSETDLKAAGLIVYQGIGGEQLRVSKIVQQLGIEPVSTYSVLNRLALSPENNFVLDRFPGVLSPTRPTMILLADMPLSMESCLPGFLQEKIAQDVRDGATLILLDGLFTLEKTISRGSVFAELLPIEFDEPAPIARFKQPLPLHANSQSLNDFLSLNGTPTVSYYRAVKPKPGSTIDAQAGNIPILIRKPYGKGMVIVWTALPCGEGEPNLLFHRWAGWADFVALIAAPKEKP